MSDTIKTATIQKRLKAYTVEFDDGEGSCEAVFAESANDARASVRDDRGTAYIDRKARRSPDLDQYAETGLTDRILLNHGWWFTCAGDCERRLDADYEGTGSDVDEDGISDNDGGTALGTYFEYLGKMYCSESCCDERIATVGARRGRQIGTVMDAADRWPGIKIRWASGDSTFKRWSRTEPVVGVVSFTFPGGAGPVDWERGDTTVRLNAGDADAWRAFSDRSKAEAADA